MPPDSTEADVIDPKGRPVIFVEGFVAIEMAPDGPKIDEVHALDPVSLRDPEFNLKSLEKAKANINMLTVINSNSKERNLNNLMRNSGAPYDLMSLDFADRFINSPRDHVGVTNQVLFTP